MRYELIVFLTIGPILGVSAYLVRWVLFNSKDSGLLMCAFISLVPLMGLYLACVFALSILLDIRSKLFNVEEF